MVSTTDVIENGVEKKSTLPPGVYQLVGWDVDTTGRRLIDEICQIAAYAPSSKFSQYVMPYKRLNPAASRRHNIRVVTVGRYRMLKDSKTKKVLKTKSEVSALNDFLQWLEDLRAKGSDGIILVCHEIRKIAAPLLLEALQKYGMMERFSAVVKGFASGYAIAAHHCSKTVRLFTLRTLTRVLLGKEEELDSAADRARLTYLVLESMCGAEEQPEKPEGSGDGGESPLKAMIEAALPFTMPVSDEQKELNQMKVVVERLNSLRPIFLPLLRRTPRERQRASTLRRVLAENGVDYEEITTTFEEKGKDGVTALVATKLKDGKSKDIEELQQILISHFDTDSKPKPETKQNAKIIGAGDASDSSAPDTTTDSPVKAPSSSGDTNTTNSPESNPSTPIKIEADIDKPIAAAQSTAS